MDASTTATSFAEGKRFPIVGALFHYLRDPLAYLESTAKLGDMVRIDMLPKEAWLLTSPALIEQVFVKSAASFHKDRFLRELKRAIGSGLLTSEGDFWKRQRRLVQPAFHRERIAGYGKVMVHHTTRELDGWRDGQTFDLNQSMMGVTANIVTECLFGTHVGDAAEVGECLEIIMDRFAKPLYVFVPALQKLPLPANKRYREVVHRLDRIVHTFIEARRTRGTGNSGEDLLGMLLDAQDDDSSQMTNEQVRDEMIVLFLAGHETTAVSLCWTFYEISKHPDVEQKLHEELDRVLGDREPTFDDLPQLQYTAQVVQESLRLYPPVWAMGREAISDVELAGRRFEAGTWVWVIPWTLHRDPRWFDDPLSFRPERWADGLARRLPKFTYLPFGGGARICIGNQFAMMEATLMLAAIARRFSLRLEPGHPVVPVPAITLRFKHGIRMRATARRAANARESLTQ